MYGSPQRSSGPSLKFQAHVLAFMGEGHCKALAVGSQPVARREQALKAGLNAESLQVQGRLPEGIGCTPKYTMGCRPLRGPMPSKRAPVTVRARH